MLHKLVQVISQSREQLTLHDLDLEFPFREAKDSFYSQENNPFRQWLRQTVWLGHFSFKVW